MKDLPEALQAILGDISSLDGIEDLSGDDLSATALRMAINKAFVGQHLVKLEFEYDKLDAARKISWNNAFSIARMEKAKVAEAEMAADAKTEKEWQNQIELKRKIGMVKNLRRDASDIITVCQSRLGQLKSEMVEARSLPNQ